MSAPTLQALDCSVHEPVVALGVVAGEASPLPRTRSRRALALATAEVRRAHGDLECDDVETILADSAATAAALTEQVAALRAREQAREAEVEMLRLQTSRAMALLNDVQTKRSGDVEEREDLMEQIRILAAEIEAAEAVALPTGTLAFAAVSEHQARATYRRVSQVRTGPVPPTVLTAISEALPAIRESMEEAGQAALDQVVRREVRARRRRVAGRR